MEYQEIIIKNFVGKNVSDIVQIEKEIVNAMENKDFFSGIGEDNIIKSSLNKDNLVLGVYNKKDNEPMGYLVATTYDLFTRKEDVEEIYKNSKPSDYFYFRVVGVKTKFRGQDIHKILLNYFEEHAKKIDANKLTTMVHPENLSSKNNFIKSGYEVIKEIYFENNTPRVIMSKFLKNQK
jgi:ribosomal protein S18 acetylase RimI-like enzyme